MIFQRIGVAPGCIPAAPVWTVSWWWSPAALSMWPIRMGILGVCWGYPWAMPPSHLIIPLKRFRLGMLSFLSEFMWLSNFLCLKVAIQCGLVVLVSSDQRTAYACQTSLHWVSSKLFSTKDTADSNWLVAISVKKDCLDKDRRSGFYWNTEFIDQCERSNCLFKQLSGERSSYTAGRGV